MAARSSLLMPENACSPGSPAEKFRQLPLEERKKRLEQISAAEAAGVLYDWDGFWSRPAQRLPAGDWSVWLVRAGRGFGKTRVGAETVRIWARSNAIVNIIGPTAGDAREVMVEGPSGILSVCPKHERPRYTSSKTPGVLSWPNGAKSLIFSADEPERLRGPQHYKLWADELAAWRRQEEAWDQAMFGLRLGSNPQAVVTTTPKPTKLIKELSKSPQTFMTQGSTYDNRANLAPGFFSNIIGKYEGTRLGRQELMAELLEDRPGALWTQAGIDADRVKVCPPLSRLVVAVDPAVSSGEDSDLTGIVVAGQGPAPNGTEWPPHYYVLDDRSLRSTPDKWAEVVVGAYKAHKADRIVAEVNNGGDLVEAILRGKQLDLAYSPVHASRGKLTRAEPIAALYEQHRVHHVGSFSALEDEMCDYVPLISKRSPDRMDALVWAITKLTDAETTEEIVTYQGPAVNISPELDQFDNYGY
jgi:phage terminase large subunit-like protein